MTPTTTQTNASAATHPSPPLGVLAIVCFALFAASIAVIVTMTGGARFPTPYDPPALASEYFGRYAEAFHIASFFQLGSAILLGLFTATVTSRLRFLGLKVAGVDIALFGGFAAAILLAVSALASWALSQPGMAQEVGALRALQLLGFSAGGPGHVAALGLLMAGVSVPSLVMRLTPRWLAWLGLILAGLCELSTLSLIFPALSILLPLSRFPAFIWLIGTGFTMPKSRRGEGPQG
jgi:hypothetical protein